VPPSTGEEKAYRQELSLPINGGGAPVSFVLIRPFRVLLCRCLSPVAPGPG